jgi:hypothetical protein
LSVAFASIKTAITTPICAKPIVGENNPALRLQRMFHAASVKALLPPREGGADEIHIIINNLLAKTIKKPTAKLTFLGSFAFTKRMVGPPQPRQPHQDDEGEPPGGNLVARLISMAFGPPW